jgi:hypothetical protein
MAGKKETAKRDLSFFNQVEHLNAPFGNTSINMPVFYYDITTINVAFLTPLKKICALLPSPRMFPLRATPWHAVTAITCFEYRDCDAGPYNEVSISFPITIDRPAPILTGLFRHITEGPMTYVHHLPVTTDIAHKFGIDFYNYPKFIANIDFKNEDGWLSCRLAEDSTHILTLSVRKIPVKDFDRWRFHGITFRDGRILRSEAIINVRKQAISRNPADVKLELGDHAISQELRDLHLGRMIHFQYMPENQAILTPVLESYPESR